MSRNCLQKGDVMCRFLFLQNIKERPYFVHCDGIEMNEAERSPTHAVVAALLKG